MASTRSASIASANGNSTSSTTMADLTACVRRTTGIRPPPLVGCSITLLGNSIIVFGGRLVPTRTMVNTIYSLNLSNLIWTLHEPPKSPVARYFHSAEIWGDKLIIFGGEGYNNLNNGLGGIQSDLEGMNALCTLGDVCIWDSKKLEWDFPEIGLENGVERAESRYAHLAVISTYVTNDHEQFPVLQKPIVQSLMIILGGQDISNSYLHSINVLNLDKMTWTSVGKWEKNIGTYRAIAVSARRTVIPSSSELSYSNGKSTTTPTAKRLSSRPSTPLRTSSIVGELAESELGIGQNELLQQQTHSIIPIQESPEPILIFSNFNFTDVRRDFDSLSCPILPNHPLESTSLSRFMTGPALPPGLRFPTGTIIGNHLILFGTFLSQTVNNFSVWSLNLGKSGASGILGALQSGEKCLLEWKKIDSGSLLSKGSWNRAVGYGNSVVVLGDRERDIATDYDHRQTNFAHVAFIDLESFGIYQPPPLSISLDACKLGLATLSNIGLTDFEIICSDGKRVACSRQLLVNRWPWLEKEMSVFTEKAKGLLRGKEEMKLISRSLKFSETLPVTLAFLQYLYTFSLCTPLQLQPPILLSLLSLATNYKELNLKALVVQALHETLMKENWTAGIIYEGATLNGCLGLQIRSLKLMMSSTRSRSSNSS